MSRKNKSLLFYSSTSQSSSFDTASPTPYDEGGGGGVGLGVGMGMTGMGPDRMGGGGGIHMPPQHATSMTGGGITVIPRPRGGRALPHARRLLAESRHSSFSSSASMDESAGGMMGVRHPPLGRSLPMEYANPPPIHGASVDLPERRYFGSSGSTVSPTLDEVAAQRLRAAAAAGRLLPAHRSAALRRQLLADTSQSSFSSTASTSIDGVRSLPPLDHYPGPMPGMPGGGPPLPHPGPVMSPVGFPPGHLPPHLQHQHSAAGMQDPAEMFNQERRYLHRTRIGLFTTDPHQPSLQPLHTHPHHISSSGPLLTHSLPSKYDTSEPPLRPVFRKSSSQPNRSVSPPAFRTFTPTFGMGHGHGTHLAPEPLLPPPGPLPGLSSSYSYTRGILRKRILPNLPPGVASYSQSAREMFTRSQERELEERAARWRMDMRRSQEVVTPPQELGYSDSELPRRSAHDRPVFGSRGSITGAYSLIGQPMHGPGMPPPPPGGGPPLGPHGQPFPPDLVTSDQAYQRDMSMLRRRDSRRASSSQHLLDMELHGPRRDSYAAMAAADHRRYSQDYTEPEERYQVGHAVVPTSTYPPSSLQRQDSQQRAASRRASHLQQQQQQEQYQQQQRQSFSQQQQQESDPSREQQQQQDQEFPPEELATEEDIIAAEEEAAIAAEMAARGPRQSVRPPPRQSLAQLQGIMTSSASGTPTHEGRSVRISSGIPQAHLISGAGESGGEEGSETNSVSKISVTSALSGTSETRPVGSKGVGGDRLTVGGGGQKPSGFG